MSRKLNIGTQKYTTIFAVDEPEFNANHKYHIGPLKESNNAVGTIIQFQKGPIKENGVNGCHNEDLIAIVIDRLQSFQKSEYKCNENEDAIKALTIALASLRQRTSKREEKGIEGTSKIN